MRPSPTVLAPASRINRSSSSVSVNGNPRNSQGVAHWGTHTSSSVYSGERSDRRASQPGIGAGPAPANVAATSTRFSMDVTPMKAQTGGARRPTYSG